MTDKAFLSIVKEKGKASVAVYPEKAVTGSNTDLTVDEVLSIPGILCPPMDEVVAMDCSSISDRFKGVVVKTTGREVTSQVERSKNMSEKERHNMYRRVMRLSIEFMRNNRRNGKIGAMMSLSFLDCVS